MTEVKITEEEARAFINDVVAYYADEGRTIPPMDALIGEAGAIQALSLAIQRERERAKEIVERNFAALENSDVIPKLIMEAVLEERERCAGICDRRRNELPNVIDVKDKSTEAAFFALAYAAQEIRGGE